MARHTWIFTRFGTWHLSELDTYMYVLWHIRLCIYKTHPCFPTQPCIQFGNHTHGKVRLIMRNKHMKFGYNLITLRKMWHIRVWDGTHTCMGQNLTPLCMGGFLVLKLIDNCIHLCTQVRGMCPCVLVRRYVIEREREIWSNYSKSLIRS